MSWNSMFGAEVYDRFVREYGLYKTLNGWLAGRSDLDRARRVLDLACGTGATTLACLERMSAQAEIVGVDASVAMIRIARAHVLDPRARFEVVPARRMHEDLAPAFDRVLCNAAFWELPDLEEVIRAVAALLAPGGRLLFNVPADRIQGAEAPIHPFHVALGREIRSWDSNLPVESGRTVALPMLTAAAAASGLALQRHDCSMLSCRQGELMELMAIPPLIRPLTPGLSDEELDTLLQKASRHVDPDEEVEVPWHYFSFQKVGADGPCQGMAS